MCDQKKPESTVPSASAIAHLCGAVRFATVSAQQDEDVAWSQFTGLHDYLEQTYPLIHRTLSREIVARGSLLYKWNGRGRGMPYALLAHMDVVPVSHPESWRYDPFGGIYDGEYILGRGAADMKCQMIAIMETIEKLIAEGFVPNQDVYLCFGHNEEVMTDHSGAKAMATLLKERGVHLEFVIDEAGCIMMNPPFALQRPVVMIGMAEKGFANLELVIHGEGGHSAEPEGRSAMEQACRFVSALKENPMPYRLIPTVETYVKALAAELPAEEYGQIMNDRTYLFRKMAEDKKCHAMVRTTIVPTVFQSGAVSNSIPSEARLILNVRILPSETVEDACGHIKSLLKDCGIDRYTLTVDCLSQPPLETPGNAVTFQILKELYTEWCEDFLVTPYLVTGGTDSKNYVGVTDQIFRVSAALSYRNQSSGAHGDNERISAVTLGNAQKLMHGLITAQSKRFD